MLSSEIEFDSKNCAQTQEEEKIGHGRKLKSGNPRKRNEIEKKRSNSERWKDAEQNRKERSNRERWKDVEAEEWK